MPMYRRHWLQAIAFGYLLCGATRSQALSLGDISGSQAIQAVRAALESGSRFAIEQLGRPDGFWGNAAVRIALPQVLQDASGLLRTLGQGQKLDELILAMNRAAEVAVPMAYDLLMQSIKTLTIPDAKAILAGGNTAVTRYFSDKTRQPIGQKFLPIVVRVIDRVHLAQQYNQIVGKVQATGLVQGDGIRVERYVTAKSLDGLFHTIAERERLMRQDPTATTSRLVQKVFGALH